MKNMYILRGEGCDLINWFNTAPFFVCHKTWPGFPTPYIVVFLCSKFIEIRRRVCSIDISGIDDRQFRLSFHIIVVLTRKVSIMYMCVKVIYFTSVSASSNFRINFRILLTAWYFIFTYFALLRNPIWRHHVQAKRNFK